MRVIEVSFGRSQASFSAKFGWTQPRYVKFHRLQKHSVAPYSSFSILGSNSYTFLQIANLLLNFTLIHWHGMVLLCAALSSSTRHRILENQDVPPGSSAMLLGISCAILNRIDQQYPSVNREGTTQVWCAPPSSALACSIVGDSSTSLATDRGCATQHTAGAWPFASLRPKKREWYAESSHTHARAGARGGPARPGSLSPRRAPAARCRRPALRPRMGRARRAGTDYDLSPDPDNPEGPRPLASTGPSRARARTRLGARPGPACALSSQTATEVVAAEPRTCQWRRHFGQQIL